VGLEVQGVAVRDACGRQTVAAPHLASRLARWERVQRPAIAVLPYAMLGVAVVLTLMFTRIQAMALLPILALSALMAAWLLWMYTLHPAWRQRPRMMLLFFAGWTVIAATLVIRDPIFGFFSWSGYFLAASLPGRWKIPGVLTVAAITATSQNGGLPKEATLASVSIYLVIIAVNMALGGGFSWFGWLAAEQNAWRSETMAKLTETNRKLEATLAENEGLHRQLLAQAREAGIMDERQRLAREIHDTLAQGLTGIITQLEAAGQPGRCTTERERHHAAALRLARESLSEARRSVHAMRPEPLEDARLPEALAGVARDWSDLTGIPAQVTTTGTVWPVPADVETALLRTAQEALANVAKHAAASRVGLTLSYLGDEVALDVRDDGVGGAAAVTVPTPRNGFGLTAMRQRVEGLSGTLDIESEPGTGTAICARLPLPAGGAA
jgi:signal transduction histidine kinase